MSRLPGLGATMTAFLHAVLVYLLPLLAQAQDIFLYDESYRAAHDPLMVDLFKYWRSFREPSLGVYCDNIKFTDQLSCGTGDRDMYSSAAAGMGLIAETVFAEVGLTSASEARANVVQTLKSMSTIWPREPHHGFRGHFAKRRGNGLYNLNEYSTIDTALLVMGGLFAGNYFGGPVRALAVRLKNDVAWSWAIKDPNEPTIYPIAKPDGSMEGNIRPFNEYYIVAYIAVLAHPNPRSRPSQYFRNFFGKPWPRRAGGLRAIGQPSRPTPHGGFPVYLDYKNFELLSDTNTRFMSSFIPQFCWFTTKGFNQDPYYSEQLLPSWLSADMRYWLDITTDHTIINGQKVRGKVFGCGAGAGRDRGYTVNRINGTEEPIFSVAIMAGFLGVADASLRQDINGRIAWMLSKNVCVYNKRLPDGSTVRIPWRCSIKYPNWRASVATSIDFATFVLGYATNFLPHGFYGMHAA